MWLAAIFTFPVWNAALKEAGIQGEALGTVAGVSKHELTNLELGAAVPQCYETAMSWMFAKREMNGYIGIQSQFVQPFPSNITNLAPFGRVVFVAVARDKSSHLYNNLDNQHQCSRSSTYSTCYSWLLASSAENEEEEVPQAVQEVSQGNPARVVVGGTWTHELHRGKESANIYLPRTLDTGQTCQCPKIWLFNGWVSIW